MVMAELPDDLIKAILIWLPVKSLIRFKCVDKSRCAMIGNPYFAEQHRTHSALRPDATHLVLMLTQFHPKYEQTILTATANSGATLDPIPPNILEHGPFYLSCCHGLISMHPQKTHKPKAAITFVYNPSTRETLSIPFNADAFEYYEFESNHIGFEPVSNQYKLVILGTGHKYRYSRKHCEIITLGGTKNNWRRVTIYPFLDYDPYDSCTYLNGALHWLTSDRQRIMVLYLKSEEFGTIPCPERPPVLFDSCQVGGHLTLVESGTYRPDKSFQLWTLKDYYNNVWVQQSFSFSLPLSKAPIGRYLRVIGGMNSGEILICLELQLFGYDMKTNKGRKINVGEHDQPYLEDIVLYTESVRCY